ncbi:MAG: 50S ribosomal protein L2, partial [Candidatus Methanomethylophilaceae archaeon]|nr:50S ribosomal protein L2 [Candidatus Methanomethylophilaceae archaeon]
MGKRLIHQRRGRGGSQYRSPSHRHVDDVRLPANAAVEGVVVDLIHAPGRTCPLAVIDINGDVDYQLAVEGEKVGQKVEFGTATVKAGNITTLAQIPEGTPVHNIEGIPGDGGKYVKTAGSSATVVSRGAVVVVQMPSGALKEFMPDCRAAIG